MLHTIITVYLVIFLLVIHFLVKLIYHSVKQYRLYQLLKHIPGPEISVPLYGNLGIFLDVLRKHEDSQLSIEFSKKLIELCKTYGDNEFGLIRFWLGPFVPLIVITDPKLAHQMLNNHDLLDKATFYTIFRYASGDGVFTCNGTKWKIQKKYVKEHFKFRALESYIDRTWQQLTIFNQRIDSGIEQNGGLFDNARPLVSCFVLDALGENLFSGSFESQINGEPEFCSATRDLLEVGYKGFMQPWTYFFSNIVFRHLANISGIKKSFRKLLIFRAPANEVIKKRYKAIVNDDWQLKNTTNHSLADSMILTRLVNSKLTKLNQIKSQINTFIIAGHDTTMSAISWMLYLLGHHPDIQRELCKEIDAFLEELKENNQKINMSNLKKLKYMECCVKETLRLYPPGPFIARRSHIPIKINDNFSLPAKVNVAISIYYFHTQEKFFKDPLRFHPERFLGINDETSCNKSAYIPFSSGLRVCVGKDYGIMQMKLFFVNLLSRYTYTALDKYGTIQPKHNFLLSAAEFPIKFEKRCLDLEA